MLNLLLTVNMHARGVDLLGRLIVTLIDLKSAWTPKIVPLYLLLLFHKCSESLLMELFQFGHIWLMIVVDEPRCEGVSSLLLLWKLVRVDNVRIQSFQVTAQSSIGF